MHVSSSRRHAGYVLVLHLQLHVVVDQMVDRLAVRGLEDQLALLHDVSDHHWNGTHTGKHEANDI
jgi:hypothetical protein